MATNNPFVNTQIPGPVPTPGVPMPGAANGQSNWDDFAVDLTDVQENSFIIPDGNYRVKCTDVEQAVSSKGNPQFVWTFEVSEGQYTGFKLKTFTAITPAAMWKVAEIVQSLGIGQVGTVVKFKRTDVLGKECGAFVEESEYNGNKRSSISRVMSLKELMESRA